MVDICIINDQLRNQDIQFLQPKNDAVDELQGVSIFIIKQKHQSSLLVSFVYVPHLPQESEWHKNIKDEKFE